MRRGPGSGHHRAVPEIAVPQGDDFVLKWNALARRDRQHMRRLVRLGRPLATPNEAALAVAYARFQRSRLWSRLFWLWFVPGIVLALGVAVRIHPVVIGVVIAMAAQALFARRNLRRTATSRAAGYS